MGERHRIGLVIGQLSIGGAEGQLLQLVRNLDRRYEAIVYCLTEGENLLSKHFAEIGVEVVEIGGRGVERVRRLARRVAQDDVEVLHSWLFLANAYAAAALVVASRKPLITSARNCKIQSRFNRVANMLAFRRSSAIVVNSSDVSAYIVDHYRAPEHKIRVIYNGVDCEKFFPSKQPTLGHQPLVVGAGRLVRQKNYPLFLKAAAALADRLPSLRFAIAGEGPLGGELENMAARLGLQGRLEFLGLREDLAQVLRSASLFWLTSQWEGMPNVVLEALATGVPVVATDVGGVSEVIGDSHCGYVVADGDDKALVDRSFEILSDGDHWREFHDRALNRAKKFSVTAMAEAVAQIYDSAIEGAR